MGPYPSLPSEPRLNRFSAHLTSPKLRFLMDAKEDLHLGFPSPPFILLILFSGLCASFFPPPPLSLFRFLLNIWKDSRQVRGNGSHSPISPQSLPCISKTSWSGPDESSQLRQRAIIRWPGLPRYAHVECIKCLYVNGSVCLCACIFAFV